MPRKNIDYSNVIFYKICCKDLSISNCYVGHTTNFTTRKSKHKSSCNNKSQKEYNINLYKFIRKNGNWDNWEMIELERSSCLDKNDARKKERKWAETLNSTLNSRTPFVTKNEIKIKEYNWKKEKIICDCGFESTKGHFARHKQSKNHFYLINKENSSIGNLI